MLIFTFFFMYNGLRSIDEFFQDFALSAAKEFISIFDNARVRGINLPPDIYFYGTEIKKLILVAERVYEEFDRLKSPYFNTYPILSRPIGHENGYFVDVGFFYELYLKKKEKGENVIF